MRVTLAIRPVTLHVDMEGALRLPLVKEGVSVAACLELPEHGVQDPLAPLRDVRDVSCGQLCTVISPLQRSGQFSHRMGRAATGDGERKPEGTAAARTLIAFQRLSLCIDKFLEHIRCAT